VAGDDGLLKAEEILDLSLDAELVVLSACNTGRGRMTGDGIVGLARAFITAGVPSVVVSLWSVADDSTAFLMTRFYEHLRGGFDKAAALHNAMLDTSARYPHPRDWAAFTLVGRAV
jgi:CHAT domain-containing protein